MDWAWLPSGCTPDVRLTVADGRFVDVTSGVRPQLGDEHLPGLVLPGLANTHSHAFHRALRGRTHSGGGSFWTWREAMYAVAARLSPDGYHALSRAVFAEMVLSGITGVGEFHYVHHQPRGTPYDDPNAMGRAVIEAARVAGLRITLLDTCYLAGGLDKSGVLPLAGPQIRFGDGDGAKWAARAESLGLDGHSPDAHGLIAPHARAGAAIHSVRAVPPEHMHPVVTWASRHNAPLHIHLSEQRAENDACRAVYGVSPTRLLYDEDVLGPRTTVVHATHLG
nr:formimidoylglutamate deiminase [Actinomycetota bacterium]